MSARLRALNEAATSRPWIAMVEDDREAWIAAEHGGVMTRPEPGEPMGISDEDAALIVALCNARDEIAALIEAASDSYRLIENSAARLALASALDALREKGLA